MKYLWMHLINGGFIFRVEEKIRGMTDEYSVYAGISDGCLDIRIAVAPLDMGKYGMEMSVSFLYSFDKNYTELFLEKLPGNERAPEALIRGNFYGTHSVIKKIEEFCTANGIEYEFCKERKRGFYF